MNKSVKKDISSSNSKNNETPVIIRREVIISEEERAREKEKDKKDDKKSVGFVERNNKKDYNIVYRNKQTKPLTVSELFGIKSNIEKKEEIKEVEKRKK